MALQTLLRRTREVFLRDGAIDATMAVWRCANGKDKSQDSTDGH